jgi:hypothetical protein
MDIAMSVAMDVSVAAPPKSGVFTVTGVSVRSLLRRFVPDSVSRAGRALSYTAGNPIRAGR